MTDNQPTPATADARDGLIGVAFALCGFSIWGFLPILIKAIDAATPLEILAHRIVWSAIFVGAGMYLARRWKEIPAIVKNRQLFGRLIVSACLITCNWLVYIWAVNNAQMLQGSLGYYISPLLSVMLGWIVLHERLSRVQWLSVLLAAGAIVNFVIGIGVVPWISLILAASFASYGLVRKTAPVGAAAGLFIETLILFSPAAGFLIYLAMTGEGRMGQISPMFDLLLLGAGAATAVPLIFFAGAARRLRLATLGLLQYLTPTLQFLLAVLLYDEPFTDTHLVTFVLIWLGLAIYSIDTWRNRRPPPPTAHSAAAGRLAGS